MPRTANATLAIAGITLDTDANNHYSAPIKMPDAKQIAMRYPCRWGGKRIGAGRKPVPGRRRVPHRRRPKLASRFPVHVTTRLRDEVPRLRNFDLAPVLRRAFVHGCDTGRFRICDFSIQGNHIHLICEAVDGAALSRGMQRWSSMVGRGINKHLGRSGKVFDGRYHEEILRSPRRVRNALCYVLQNARRHGLRIPRGYNGVDPFSSAWYFDGWADERWREGLSPPDDGDGPSVARPHTWLRRTGWRRHGLIGVDEVPAAARTESSRSRPAAHRPRAM